MKVRPYNVAVYSDSNTKEVLKFVVTDAQDKKELDSGKRPVVAEFPVSILHEEDEQRKRANTLRDALTVEQVANRLDH